MPENDGNAEQLRASLQPSQPCPPIEALAAASERPEIRRHLETCARCRTELSMLAEFETAAPSRAEAADVQWIESELLRRSERLRAPLAEKQRGWGLWLGGLFRTRPGYAWAMAAAAAAVVIVAGVSLRHPYEQPLMAPGNAVYRSTQITLLAPVGDVSEAPSVFRWDAAPGAAHYDVQLTGVDGAALWSASATSAEVAVPPKIRAQFQPGRAFRWQVTARNAAGEKIAVSDSQIFHTAATSH